MADPLVVDRPRPAVARVAALPREYRVTDAEWRVLMVLACDSFDGQTSAPGLDNLAAWTGLYRSSVAAAISRLTRATDYRPALLSRVEVSRGGRERRTRYGLLLPDCETVQPGRTVQPSGGPGRLPAKQSAEPSGGPGRLPAKESAEPSGEVGRLPDEKQSVEPSVKLSAKQSVEPSGQPGHSLPFPTHTPPTPPTGTRPEPAPRDDGGGGRDGNIQYVMSAYRVSADIARDVVTRCEADPTTRHSAAGRLRQEEYTRRLIADVTREHREREAEHAPRCEDHPTYPATGCSCCHADVKVGQRPREYVGRHYDPDEHRGASIRDLPEDMFAGYDR